MNIRDAVDAIYKNDNNRRPTWHIVVYPNNGIGWTEIKSFTDCEWQFEIGKVPQLRLHTDDIDPQRVADFATFFKNILVYVGFNGLNLIQFTGRILDINNDEKQLEVTAEGSSWPLDVPFHKVILAFDNLENNLALTQILDLAVIAEYDVDMPTRQLGANVPQVLEFATYGEAFQKVLDLGGGAWFELPGGVIKARDLYVLDKFNTSIGASRVYWRGDMIGANENPPAGSVGRPRLDSWHRESRVRETKNRCFVTGSNRVQVNADGSIDNIPTEGEAQAASGYILNPDGTQAYNDLPFNNELLDDNTTAGTEAARVVNFENGLHEHFTVGVRGDPLLVLRQNIRLIDAKKGMDRYMVVTGYTSRIASNQFASTITALNINSADAAIIQPIALFHHVTDKEVVGGGMKGIVMLDGSESFAIDGTITNWQFVDNQTPKIINQSGASAVATGLYDPATATLPLKVTLTVASSNGLTDSITLTVPLT